MLVYQRLSFHLKFHVSGPGKGKKKRSIFWLEVSGSKLSRGVALGGLGPLDSHESLGPHVSQAKEK